MCRSRIVSLRERVELESLDKNPERVELLSVEIILVEYISVLKESSIFEVPFDLVIKRVEVK